MATATQTSGRSAPPKFVPGFDPEAIALRAIPGKPVNGYSGAQVLFHLTNGRPWYADQVTAKEIERMRIQPGEFFEVSKTETRGAGNSRVTAVELKALVIPEEPNPPAPSASPNKGKDAGSKETANHTQNNGSTARMPAAIASTAVPAAVAVVVAPMNSHGETSKVHLTRCYQDAIDIALAAKAYAQDRGLTIIPEFADLRAMAATICINESGRR